MLKSILNLEGAQGLTKNEQKSINGGFFADPDSQRCNPEMPYSCLNGIKYHLGNGCWIWMCGTDGGGPGGTGTPKQ